MARGIAIPATFGFALLAFSAPKTPRLVWNATASAPVGLYAVTALAPLARGELVLARPPRTVANLAVARGYLPIGVPFVKRIAALTGDRICSNGTRIAIDGRIAAVRRKRDRLGRPLPGWRGCRTLNRTDVFLLMEGVPDSFDGRYFGPIKQSTILGRLVPLWTR